MAQREADDVRAVLQQISEAWQARRYEDLSQLFAPDMVFSLPGQAVRLEGRDAIVASYQQFMDRITLTSYREDQHSVDVWGGTAVASFRWDMAWLAGDVPNHDTGCDVFAFSHTDGRWLAVWRTMLMEPKPAQG
jgi:uncharacterized protein (TIGR02246 family)